uniref:porin family protein n=1 Tax=Prevotella sp. TaxID=59823 RepID=UPI004024B9B7
MKKLFTAAIVALSMMFGANNAQAQVKFGIKGGLNVTSMSLDKDKLLDTENQAGFFIGPTVKFTLPIVGLGIDASALYDQREAKIKGDINGNKVETSSKLKTQAINVPINVRYGVGLGSVANVFLFAGPQFGFNVGDKNQSLLKDAAEWKLKSSNFSVNVGLGFTVLSHLQVSANYNIACGKTGD